MKKVISVLEKIARFLSKPIDKLADLVTSENLTPAQCLLTLLGMVICLPLFVLLGLLSVIVDLIRGFLIGLSDTKGVK